MIEFLESLPPALLRSGLILMASVAAICLLLRLLKIVATTIRRFAYFGVVLQGCLLMQASITIPWLPSTHATPAAVSVSEPVETPTIENWHTDSKTVFEHEPSTPRDPAFPPQLDDVSSPGVPWFALLGIVWLGGAIVIVCRCAWNYAIFLRNVAPCGECDPEWAEEWKQLQQEFGVRVNIPLELSSDLGPMLCRFPRGYRLIVPAAYWRELEPIQRTAVLRHELAHLQRCDVWKSLVVRVLALPHWFNPLVWRIVRKFDECAEWACDEAARAASPDHVTNYARALLQLGNRSRSQALFMPSANGSSLSGRIRRLLSSLPRKDSNMKKMLVVTSVLAISLVSVFRIELSAEEAAVPNPAKTDAAGPSAEKAPVLPILKLELSAAPTSEKTEPAAQEAVIDLAEVFKNDKQFERDRATLKQEIDAADTEIKELTEEIRSIQSALNAADRELESNRDRVEELTNVIAIKRTEFDTRRKIAQQQFLRRESEIYRKIYNRVTEEVAVYAKEHGIRVVRRSHKKKSDGQDQISTGSSDAGSKPANEVKIVATSEPANVIKWMQREVIYGEPAEKMDITAEIIKRLNEQDAAAQKAQPSEAPNSAT